MNLQFDSTIGILNVTDHSYHVFSAYSSIAVIPCNYYFDIFSCIDGVYNIVACRVLLYGCNFSIPQSVINFCFFLAFNKVIILRVCRVNPGSRSSLVGLHSFFELGLQILVKGIAFRFTFYGSSGLVIQVPQRIRGGRGNTFVGSLFYIGHVFH